MTTLEKKTTNELFRFVNTKQIGLDTIEEIDHHYIQQQYKDLSTAQLAEIESVIDLFYTTYLSLIDPNNTASGSTTDAVKNAADAYTLLFTDEQSFTSQFPHLLKIVRWVDDHKETMTKQQFIYMVEAELGTSISTFVLGSSGAPASFMGGNAILPDVSNNTYLTYWFRLWDNLIIHTCQLKNPSCIHLSSQTIVLLAVLKRIASGDASLNEHKDFLDAFTATPLLPLNINQLFMAYHQPSGGANQTANTFANKTEKTTSSATAKKTEDAKLQYGNLLTALNEIKALQQKKILELNSKRLEAILNSSANSNNLTQPPSETPTTEGGEGSGSGSSTGTTGGTRPPIIIEGGTEDPVVLLNTYTLTEADMASLSAETIAIIQQYAHGVTNITFQELLDIINGLITRQIKTIAEGSTKVGTIRIGNVIIRSDEYCTDMAEENIPVCTILDKKDFKSEGALANYASIGDLIVTKQQLIKYDLGEVAHVENIMQGEERSRSFITTDRLEELTLTETETENETVSDTQTTERFSVEKESTNVINDQKNINFGVNISADFGPVQASTSFGYSSSHSSNQSNHDATSFSKDVTTRALKRVKEKVRTLRSKLQIHEVVDKTEHKYSNIPGEDHINGVYRWLDKYYLNKVLNYGKRLMLEFTVPEPASFYIFNKMLKAKGSNDYKEMPTDPNALKEEIRNVDGDLITTLKLNSFKDISKENYEYFAAYYNLTDMEPYPAETKIIGKSLKVTNAGKDAGINTDELTVPDGYNATSFKSVSYFTQGSNRGGVLQVGNIQTFSINTTNFGTFPSAIASGCVIPISAKAWNWDNNNTCDFIINVQVKCELSDAGIDKWRLKLYNAIMEKYQQDLRDYEEWLRAQEIYDLPDMGNNPDINRNIEQTELKRRCLEMFSGQRFESFDATVNGIPNVSSYPEFDFMEAIKEGSMARFFEQAFDWKNMTYEFYPYYYARKKMWLTLNNIQEKNDSVFESFLKSGYARVVVPVQPGFELFLALYAGWSWLNKGESIPLPLALLFYSGKGMPNVGIDHPLFASVMNELSQIQTLNEDEPIEVGHYIQKVPTNLVYLAKQHLVAGESPTADLPDHSSDPDLIDYL